MPCLKSDIGSRNPILKEGGRLTGALNLAKIILRHASRPQKTALDRTQGIGWQPIHNCFLDYLILADLFLSHEALDEAFGVIKCGDFKDIGSQLEGAVVCR